MLRRLHAVDRLLLLVLVPLWLLCFTQSVRSVLRPAGTTSLRVSAWPAPDVHPEVVALAPWFSPDEVGVRVGDRLVELAGADMRGVGGFGFFTRFLSAAWTHERPPAVVEREGATVQVAITPASFAVYLPFLAIAPFFALFGVLILLKAPRSGLARATFHVFLVAAFFFAPFSGPDSVPWLFAVVFALTSLLVAPLMVRALLVFPHGVMPSSRWLRLLPYPFVALGITHLAVIAGFPYAGRYAEVLLNAASGLTVVVALVMVQRIYRRVDPVVRRQLKWSLLGSYVALVPPILGAVWMTVYPEQRYLAASTLASFALIPPFAYLALYRYDLFDVDRLLSATVVYNLVLVALAASWLLLAPRLGEAASSWLGVPSSVGEGGAALGLAALVVPAVRKLRPRLDALLFREQRGIQTALDALCGELSAAGDAKALLLRIGEALHDVLRPTSTVIYGRDGERYVALFVEGRAAAAELPADGPVLATLRERRGPVGLDGQIAGREGGSADPFAAAALSVLNAAVVLPVAAANGGPAALVTLGPKRSGDLYTQTEVHLLRAVADRAALELQRFDERQFREESRTLHEAMRRYVPGAIAERIEQGDALEAGEREVTVLFVDVRGYTSLSEGSRAEDVFSTINRYTRTVSELVRDAGGTVVEFNGDGMMAVFGAPAELPEKERAAVRAARRIAHEVEGIEHEGRRLSVGIGVATGVNFVGNIQAADRMIWSAIGNTTNLAARLQSLTRDLEASVIVDAATHAALGDDGDRFRRLEQIVIRGRVGRFDVFALPLR